MTGLQAISAANGWAISFVGILIVFTGLVLLALSISQLHRLLKVWDERKEYAKCFAQKWKSRPIKDKTSDDDLKVDMRETARQARIMIQFLGEPFSLGSLLEMAKTCDLYRPYSSINDLVCQGYIVPDGRGFFHWNAEKLS